MRAVVLDAHGLSFRDDFPLEMREDETPVRVQVAGICETDLQLINGYMGFKGVLGHEFVGIAEAGKFAGRRVVGEINCSCHACDLCRSGLANHCPNRSVIGILNHDGAFADVVFVPESNLHAVPDNLPNDRAVFAEPLAAAFRIPEQVDMDQHETAVVIGDGRLAWLIAQVVSRFCDVTVVGKHRNKLAQFEKFGFATIQLDVVEMSREFDLAIDCCGSVTGIPTAMRLLKPRGTLVLKTTTSEASGPDLAPIVIDEVTVVGSRCGPFEPAISALENNEIEVDSLVTARLAIEDADQAFRTAADPAHRKVLLDIASYSN